MLSILGGSMLALAIGLFLLDKSEFTKTRDFASGLIIYKHKASGERFLRCAKSGMLFKINDNKSDK